MGGALVVALAACTAPHNEMRDLVNKDRSERKSAKSSLEWQEIAVNDERRRRAVLDELRAGRITSADDYCGAATIYQRSGRSADLKAAFAFATLCAQFDPNSERAAVLEANTWDRYMISMGSGQWYGTQYEWVANGNIKLLPIAENLVSEEVREKYGLPSLRKLSSDLEYFNKNKVAQPDRLHVPPFLDKATSMY